MFIFKNQTETNLQNVKCDQCIFIADIVPGLTKHIRKEHTDASDHCEYCDYAAPNPESLKTHMYDCHEDVRGAFKIKKTQKLGKFSQKGGGGVNNFGG